MAPLAAGKVLPLPLLLLLLLQLDAATTGKPPAHIWHDFRPSFFPVLPTWEPTWDVSQSTIIQPCNSAGYMTPSETAGWGIVDCAWRLRLRPQRPCSRGRSLV
jgi:hypothetical protein